jgi:uncharacterized protein (TIGR02646 family)
MIRVERPAPPQSLDGPESLGGRERAKSIEFYGESANREAKFPFKAYKDKAIADALTSIFGGKCAYCEGYYDQFEPVDIEHFRPKGGYAHEKRLEVPGYYWLAAEWTNLLPSCIDCNRTRYHKFARIPPHLSGKANRFPLANEGRRARGPGDERHERPLLLDPCRDRPEDHLAFDDDGHVDPARDARGRLSPKGKTSIEVYGLDRDEKVRARRRVMKHLRVSMLNVERLATRLDECPDDPQVEQDLADAYRQLSEYAEPAGEFAQMCRQAIRRFEDRLLPDG